MIKNRHFCILFAALLPLAAAASAQQPSAGAQQPSASAPPASQTIRLNVVVTPKSGPPVADLEQRDFTLLDNNSIQPIRSFKTVTPAQKPVEVILLIDAVNSPFDTVSYERNKVQEFLRANGGHLAYPTTVAVLTDQGTQIQKGLSTDGNTMSDWLGRYTIGLRDITRSGGFWGATERFQASLTAIGQLAGYGTTLPGRKVVIWISPGWPLLAEGYLESRQQRQVFSEVVSLSTELRQANLTLYNINPLGIGESLSTADYYQDFVKGISKPSQVSFGNLALPVLAVQSGGLAIVSNSDVVAMLKRCLADLQSWYEITFDAAASEKPDVYHHIQIKLDKPGLTARTRDGYYTRP